MTPAKIFLGLLLLILIATDALTLARRARRAFAIEVAVFLIGGVMVMYPEMTTWVAERLGLSRGVDLVLYVVVIVLVREAIVNRSIRLQDEERITAIVRELAIRGMKPLP